MDAEVPWFSHRVVVAKATERLTDIAQEVAAHAALFCAVVDENHRLLGVLRLNTALTNAASGTRLLADLLPPDHGIPHGTIERYSTYLHETAGRGGDFAVTDSSGHFLGLITPESLFASVLAQRDDFRRALEKLTQEQAQFVSTVEQRFAKPPSAAEQELLRSIATFSHDARSPLRSIQLFARELLNANDTKLGQEGRYFAEAIARAAVRLETLANETLARVRDLSASPAPETNLREVVDDALLLHHALLRERAAQIDVRGDFPTVIAHYAPLLQIVANLLSNAVAHVPADRTPRVQVWTDSSDGFATLHLKDNGAGMPCDPPAASANDTAAMVVTRKNGLGLSIARAAAKQLGAELDFANPPEGGCDVSVRLRRAS